MLYILVRITCSGMKQMTTPMARNAYKLIVEYRTPVAPSRSTGYSGADGKP